MSTGYIITALAMTSFFAAVGMRGLIRIMRYSKFEIAQIKALAYIVEENIELNNFDKVCHYSIVEFPRRSIIRYFLLGCPVPDVTNIIHPEDKSLFERRCAAELGKISLGTS